MTPPPSLRGGKFGVESVKLMNGALFRQTKYQYAALMTKEGSTKIVNFMTPGLHFHVNKDHKYYQ